MLFAGRYSLDIRMAFVLAAIIIAILIHISGFDWIVAEKMYSFGILGGFIIGAFYTFGITTPTAIMLILEMMRLNGAEIIAVFAALSAAIVDTILFTLLREKLEKSTSEIAMKINQRVGRRIEKGNAFTAVVGFLLFGSPFPDELALAFMGIVKIQPVKIFLIVFFAKLLTLLLAYNAIIIF